MKDESKAKTKKPPERSWRKVLLDHGFVDGMDPPFLCKPDGEFIWTFGYSGMAASSSVGMGYFLSYGPQFIREPLDFRLFTYFELTDVALNELDRLLQKVKTDHAESLAKRKESIEEQGKSIETNQ